MLHIKYSLETVDSTFSYATAVEEGALETIEEAAASSNPPSSVENLLNAEYPDEASFCVAVSSIYHEMSQSES